MHSSWRKREAGPFLVCCVVEQAAGVTGELARAMPIAGASRSDNSNGRKSFGHSSYDQLRLRQMLNRDQNQEWNREENRAWILTDVSALQNVQFESSSSCLFLGSELD